MPKPRKPSKLKPLKTLKIFCEGEKTEPNYLKGYIATLDNEARKSVVLIEKTKKNTPIQLVEEAIKAKKSPQSLDEDEFWVVYDRESVAKYSDENHSKAFDKAKRARIHVALCNVCFEYWILLHFLDTDAPYSSYDDLRANSILNEEFRIAGGRNYEKSSASLFASIRDRVSIARERGKRLNDRGERSAHSGRDKPYHINPYVGIVALLQAIDDLS